MAPAIEVWPASELESRVLENAQGARRKGFEGNLKACELLEMMQYRCDVEENPTSESTTRCWQVPRLFRRCKDGQGTFMVETTAWEKNPKR